MKIIIILLIALILTACGQQVTVYPNEVGYKVNADGLSREEYPPGTHRLDACNGTSVCPSLIRIQNSRAAHEVTIDRVFLPISKVDLEHVGIAVQFRIKDNKKARLRVVTEVNPRPATDAHETNAQGREKIISTDDIWKVYLERVVPALVIDGLKSYSVDQTLSEVNTIGHNIRAIVNKELGDDNPIEITELSFNNGIGQVPSEVITALRKLYAVDSERERQIRSLIAGIEVEKRRQEYQILRVANDKKNAEAAGTTYAEYVRLKIAERFSDAAEDGAAAAMTAAENRVPFGIGNMTPPDSDKD